MQQVFKNASLKLLHYIRCMNFKWWPQLILKLKGVVKWDGTKRHSFRENGKEKFEMQMERGDEKVQNEN